MIRDLNHITYVCKYIYLYIYKYYKYIQLQIQTHTQKYTTRTNYITEYMSQSYYIFRALLGTFGTSKS